MLQLGPQEIFIVDTDRRFSRQVAMVAADVGWTVYLCGAPLDLSARLAETANPALVVMDVTHESFDFLAILEQLETATRPVRLICSANDDVAEALAARMMAQARQIATGPCLVKPVSSETLRIKLDAEAAALRGAVLTAANVTTPKRACNQ